MTSTGLCHKQEQNKSIPSPIALTSAGARPSQRPAPAEHHSAPAGQFPFPASKIVAFLLRGDPILGSGDLVLKIKLCLVIKHLSLQELGDDRGHLLIKLSTQHQLSLNFVLLKYFLLLAF